MLLHYCQLVILDVLREHLFVKETQLLPRNLVFLSFFWLQGREKAQGTWVPAKPFLGSTVRPRKRQRPRTTLPGHLPPPSPGTQLHLNSPGHVCLTWSSKFPAMEVGWPQSSGCGSLLEPRSRGGFSIGFWVLKPSFHSG